MKIVVGGQKGGTGKSTIAFNLAIKRMGEGRDVAVIDADNQSSISSLNLLRQQYETGDPLQVIRPPSGNARDVGQVIRASIEDLAKRYEDVIVDVAGRDSVVLRNAAVACDMILIPLKPSQIDIMTLDTMEEILEQVIDGGINPGLRVLAVTNMAPPQTNATDVADTRQILTEYPRIPLSNHVIRTRASIMRAPRTGASIWEYRPYDGKAAAELDFVYREVFA